MQGPWRLRADRRFSSSWYKQILIFLGISFAGVRSMNAASEYNRCVALHAVVQRRVLLCAGVGGSRARPVFHVLWR